MKGKLLKTICHRFRRLWIVNLRHRGSITFQTATFHLDLLETVQPAKLACRLVAVQSKIGIREKVQYSKTSEHCLAHTISAVDQGAKRPRKSNSCQRSYKVKETWTHEFFCLADSGCISVPSHAVKFQLQSAGLGRKKIIFGWKDNPFTFKTKLEEVFPKTYRRWRI